jgi:hypothetical protein
MNRMSIRGRLLLSLYGLATLGTLLYTIGAPWRAV